MVSIYIRLSDYVSNRYQPTYTKPAVRVYCCSGFFSFHCYNSLIFHLILTLNIMRQFANSTVSLFLEIDDRIHYIARSFI